MLYTRPVELPPPGTTVHGLKEPVSKLPFWRTLKPQVGTGVTVVVVVDETVLVTVTSMVETDWIVCVTGTVV